MLRMQRGSGYEQAEAELRFVKAVEVSVVLSPPPRACPRIGQAAAQGRNRAR
jgi:hypothetical protein